MAMGSPLGPLLANMFMCSIEEKLEEKSELPSFYKRYVDDTLAIMPDLHEANIFLDKLNSYHRNLKFTMEIAELNNKLNIKLAERKNALTQTQKAHKRILHPL